MNKSTNQGVAYIDGANLHNGSKQLGWELDYKRLRIWLREKYGVEQAYLFLGLVPRYKSLYTDLQEKGFTLVFKEVTYDNFGKIKGNCDADLVVQAMKDAYEQKYKKAILISSDGDYASLVSFLIQKGKNILVLSPYKTEKCSVLLKRTEVSIAYISDKKNILGAQKEKAPDADVTA